MIKNFIYWAKHWKAFNNLALTLGCWHFRFLLHDWYKPWLCVFFSKDKVRRWHRKWSNHHPENGGNDYLAMIIDWECARFTKPNKTLNAKDTMRKYYPELEPKLTPIFEEIGL